MHGIDEAKEEAIFAEWRSRLREKQLPLYRDGVPNPSSYWQAQRVIFVTRDPNIPDQKREHNMCDEVKRDCLESPWWHTKMLLFAHAVGTAMDGGKCEDGFDKFESIKGKAKKSKRDDVSECLWRFGYMQIKKTGGGPTSKAAVLKNYAEQYSDLLRRQIDLYKPNLLIGCGVDPKAGRPAHLLMKYVLDGSEGRRELRGKFAFWKRDNGPSVLEYYHPADRKSHEKLYHGLGEAVTDVQAELS